MTMTDDQIRNLLPGAELDALVAEYVDDVQVTRPNEADPSMTPEDIAGKMFMMRLPCHIYRQCVDLMPAHTVICGEVFIHYFKQWVELQPSIESAQFALGLANDWRITLHGSDWSPSTDWAIAGPLLEEMGDGSVEKQGEDYRCQADSGTPFEYGTTGPHAIAIAYVLWMRAKKSAESKGVADAE